MILGLTGYSSAGKDTVADYLVKEHGFTRLAFADKVRDLAEHLNPSLGYPEMPLSTILENLGWDEAKQIPDVRQYLQTLGTACREIQGENVWIQAVDNEHWESIARARRNSGHVVITDVRFANEAHWVELSGGRIVRVTRPGVGPVNDHRSETELDSWVPGWYIQNDRGLEGLHGEVDEMMSMFEGLDSE